MRTKKDSRQNWVNYRRSRHPVQIDLQKQIDELIYSLTSFKINYDEDEWVPEDDIEQKTMMRLKESL